MTSERARRFQRVAQCATLLVLALDGILLVSGVITPRQALLLFASVEVPLACLSVVGVAWAIRMQRRAGMPLRAAFANTMKDSPFHPLVQAEMRSWRGLFLWVRGRVSVPAGVVTVFDSGKGTLAIPAAFVVATGIEMAVLHVLIPWMWLQGVVLVLSVWSLLMLLGHWAIDRTHPHFAMNGRLILRKSGDTVAEVDLDDIGAVAPRRRFTETAATIADGRLFLPNADGTTVDVSLKSPIRAHLPGLLPGNRRSADVCAISIYVDDAGRLVSHVRPRTRNGL